MKKVLKNVYFSLFMTSREKNKKIILFIAIIVIPLTYLLVRLTGGIQYVYSHTMYIAIILGALLYGVKGGIIFAVIGGLVLGPFMPIDTLTGEQQLFINWVYRLFIFVLIGTITGLFSESTKKHLERIIILLSIHPDTKIPLLNSVLRTKLIERKISIEGRIVYVIRILNQDNVTDILGLPLYSNLLNSIYTSSLAHFTNHLDIFQMDTNRLIFIIDKDEQLDLSKEIIEWFSKPFIVKDIPIYIDVCLGSSLCGKSLEECVEKALLASRSAKLKHVQHQEFIEDLSENQQTASILGSFQIGLNNQDLYLVYQPIIDVITGKTVSVEVLIRWNHKIFGELAPADFIPLIENTHLINKMTEWIIRQILSFNDYRDINFAINISPNSVNNMHYMKKIVELIKNNKSTNITFELTETTIMEYNEDIFKVLQLVRNSGIGINIDDFGTGYSSLSYFAKYPINTIKIDKYFTKNIKVDKDIFHITKTIIDLAHKLNKKVTVEGVEDIETLEIVKGLGCDYIQGFYMSRPLIFKDFKSWIEKEKNI